MTPMPHDVLVVDDSAVMRAMLIRVLKLSGLPIGTVHQAGDGQSALAVLAAHTVDLALIDINMPVMNGDELLDRIRADERTQRLAVVVVSTERSDTRIESFERRGAAYIHKPFTPEEIRAAASKAMGEVTHA